MKIIKSLLLSAAAFGLLLTSCQKDPIQNPSTTSNLSNVATALKAPAMVYNVSSIVWEKIEGTNLTNPIKVVLKAGKETNAGTFSFNVDSTGSYSYTIDGQLKTGKFKWRETILGYILIQADYNFNPQSSFFTDYILILKEKNKQYWKGIETTSANKDPLHGQGTALISLITLTK